MKKNPLYYSDKLRKSFISGIRSITVTATKYPCPFPCIGHVRELIVEKDKQLTAPPGFHNTRQFECDVCGATWVGTSKIAVSRIPMNTPIGRVQLKAWRIKRSHGKWIQKGWKGRKYVFAGYW